MKKLIILSAIIMVAANCRKTSTCTCKTKDGFGETSTITSNKQDVQQFEKECRETQVRERDGSLSPCVVS